MLIALALGAVLPLQASINANLRVGLSSTTTVATLVSFAAGTLVLLATSLLHSSGLRSLALLGEQRWWMLLGGPLGAAFLFGMTYLAPRLGLTTRLSLVVAGQVLTSIGIDRIGLGAIAGRPFTAMHALGVVCIFVGTLLLTFER